MLQVKIPSQIRKHRNPALRIGLLAILSCFSLSCGLLKNNPTVQLGNTGGKTKSDADAAGTEKPKANRPPTISAISSQSAKAADDLKIKVQFTIKDEDGELDCTQSMAMKSSNPTLLPIDNVVFAGTYPNCTAELTPASKQSGNTDVTFVVSDGLLPAETSFSISIGIGNKPPIVSGDRYKYINKNEAPPEFMVKVYDQDSPAGSCDQKNLFSEITASKDFVSELIWGGQWPDCMVKVIPKTDFTGFIKWNVWASDGEAQGAKSVYALYVSTPPEVVSVGPAVASPKPSATAISSINSDAAKQTINTFVSSKAADPNKICTASFKQDYNYGVFDKIIFSFQKGQTFAISRLVTNGEFNIVHFTETGAAISLPIPEQYADFSCSKEVSNELDKEAHAFLLKNVTYYSEKTLTNQVCTLSAGSSARKSLYSSQSTFPEGGSLVKEYVLKPEFGCTSPSGKFYQNESTNSVVINGVMIYTLREAQIYLRK